MRGFAKMAMASMATSQNPGSNYEGAYNENYGPENRRDRRGRYAPKYEFEDEYRGNEGGSYRMGHDKGWEVRPLEERYDPNNYRSDDRGDRMIGFESRMNDRRPGTMEMHDGHMEKHHMERGHAETEQEHELDRRTAVEWVNRMENSDGSRGEHFTMEETERVRKNKGWECDPVEFWVAMNAMWSDGAVTARKYNVDKMDYWADRAKEFIMDKDAVPGKLARYYHYIVRHEK